MLAIWPVGLHLIKILRCIALARYAPAKELLSVLCEALLNPVLTNSLSGCACTTNVTTEQPAAYIPRLFLLL